MVCDLNNPNTKIEVKASNGKKSILYDDLLKTYNEQKEAFKTYLTVQTNKFKEWFKDSKHIDKNEEPILYNNNGKYYFTNNNDEIKDISSLNNNDTEKLVEKQNIIKDTDRIIWGHPAIGKTTLLQSNPNAFIDWDDEFNRKRDKWIADKSNTIKGTPEYKKARNEYMINYEKYPDYIQFVTKIWNKTKDKANKENKRLLASPHMLLNLFPNDFDKIINTPDSVFMERAIKRSGGDEINSRLWKEGINKTLEKVDKSKLITTDKYIGELLNSNQLFSKTDNNINYNSNNEVLAPNGNVSKLFKDIEKLEGIKDKQQVLQLYKQTRSKEFKDWFGNSKVVDENGEPLIVYHGTRINKEFDTFIIQKERKNRYNFAKIGHFFSPSIDIAKMWIPENISAKKSIDNKDHYFGDLSKVYPVFLRLENPDTIDDTTFSLILDNEETYIKSKNADGLIIEKEKGNNVDDRFAEDQYVVFESNQIKSVFNQGTFSKTDDNIKLSQQSNPSKIYTDNQIEKVYTTYKIASNKVHEYNKARELQRIAGLNDYVDNRMDVPDSFDTMIDGKFIEITKSDTLNENEYYDGDTKFISDKKLITLYNAYLKDIKEQYLKEVKPIIDNHKRDIKDQIYKDLANIPLFKILKDKLNINGISIEHNLKSERKDGTFGSVDGLYYPNTRKIVISDNMNPENTIHTILHEMLHNATYNKLEILKLNLGSNEEQETYNKLKDLFNYVKELGKDHYGLTDIHEFISELYTNKNFVDYLNTVPYENTTLLSKIWQYIAELLGIKRGTAAFEGFNLAQQIIDMSKIDTIDNTIPEGAILMKESENLSELTPLLDNFNTVKIGYEDELHTKEKSTYDILENGNKVRDARRITMDFLPNFYLVNNKRKSIEEQADDKWKAKDPNEPVNIQTDKKDTKLTPMTKEEYINWRNKALIVGQSKGRIIGNRITASVSTWSNNKEATIAAREQIQNDINNLKNKNYKEVYPDKIGAFIEDKEEDTDTKLLIKLFGFYNTNIMNGEYKEGISDKPYFELPVYNALLGFAGKFDMVVEHFDGTVSGFEFKSGANIRNEIQNNLVINSLFKFGDTTHGEIFNNEDNRAKLQLVLYAVLAKAQNPKLRFRDLFRLVVNRREDMKYKDITARIDVSAFLDMIEKALSDKNFIKELNDNGKFNIPTDVLQQLTKSSPNLFNPTHYSSGEINHDISYDIENKATEKMDDIHKIEFLTNDYIKQLEYYTNLANTSQDPVEKHNAKLKQTEYTKKLVQLKAGGRDIVLNPKDAMGIFDSYFMGMQEFKLPILKVLQQHKGEQYKKANNSYRDKMQPFDKVSNDLLQEYNKRSGKIANKNWKGIAYKTKNKTGIYDGLTRWETEFETGTINRERLIVVYDINDTVNKDKVNNKDYIVKGKYIVKASDEANFDTLTYVQKQWLVEANKLSYDHFISGGNHTAFMDTTFSSDGNTKTTYKEAFKKQNGFEWFEGWFPKLWKQEDELEYEAGQNIIGDNMFTGVLGWLVVPFKDFNSWRLRNWTYFHEQQYENYENLSTGLPIKYLGNDRQMEHGDYSANIHLAFSSFVQNMEFKRYMDEVYTLSKGIQNYIRKEGWKNGIQNYSQEIEFIDLMIPYELLGQRRGELNQQHMFSKGGQSIAGITGDKRYPISWIKVLKSLNRFSSKTIMAGRLRQGAGNFIQGTMTVFQNSIKDSIAKKLIKGITENDVDFTVTEWLSSFKEYVKLLKDFGTGNYRNNKTWLLGRKFMISPEDYHSFVPRSMDILSRHPDINKGNILTVIQQLGDEAIMYMTMIAQMKHGKNWVNKKSYYDDANYSVNNGKLVWNGGIRGKYEVKVNHTESVTQLLTELDEREIRKLSEVQKLMQGAYRKDEQTMFEMTLLGMMVMPLKKWIPTILRRIAGGKVAKEELGYYKPSLKDISSDVNDIYRTVDENGKPIPILEWHDKVVEGRFRTLLKMMLFVLSGGNLRKDMKWEKLDVEQKKNLIEVAINLAFLAGGYAIWALAFKGVPDDDVTKKWVKQYLVDNPSQLTNPKDMAKTLSTASQPIMLKKTMDVVQNTLGFMFNTLGSPLGITEFRTKSKSTGIQQLLGAKHNIKFLDKMFDNWTYSAMFNQWTKDAQNDKALFGMYNKLR